MTDKLDETVFDGATFYDCEEDSSELFWTTPEDAIVDYINTHGAPDVSDYEAAQGLAPITVYAHNPIEVNKTEWLQEKINQFERTLFEDWHEEFGDPNGMDDLINDLDGDTKESILSTILPLWENHMYVWKYEQVATREYSAKELAEMFPPEVE